MFERPRRVAGDHRDGVPVGDESAERNAIDERRCTDAAKAVVRHRAKAHKVARGVGQRQNPGAHTAFRAANGVVLRPYFARWPCRRTLTMLTSTMVYSMSGLSGMAQKIRFETIFFVNRETACTHCSSCRTGLEDRAMTACLDDPQHRLQEQPIVPSAPPGGCSLDQTMRLLLRTLGVREHKTFHPKCDSHLLTEANPNSPQNLKRQQQRQPQPDQQNRAAIERQPA
ncbi:hypothetical protein [Paracoccus halophilus]|uniref:hypothetical protein n=1 Tax=Paracoccus halophilus TaxID=376733 RepID=UPI001587510E|nr:hypothetical protein [Paracoccus halophilus]